MGYTSSGSWVGDRTLHPTWSIPSGHCSTPSQRCFSGIHKGFALVMSQLNWEALQPENSKFLITFKPIFGQTVCVKLLITSTAGFVIKRRAIEDSVANFAGVHPTPAGAIRFVGGFRTLDRTIAHLLKIDQSLRRSRARIWRIFQLHKYWIDWIVSNNRCCCCFRRRCCCFSCSDSGSCRSSSGG
jgi:hypothetical protein